MDVLFPKASFYKHIPFIDSRNWFEAAQNKERGMVYGEWRDYLQIVNTI
jgi:hypothetical protein